MSDKSDFERFWKSKPHLKAYEPMAAAWQAWQAARQAPASVDVDPDIQLIQERDYWEEKATELAEDVGKFLGIEMGEHSSDNCPVQNAIDALFNTHPPAKVPEALWGALADCVSCFNCPEWSDKCEEVERRATKLLNTTTPTPATTPETEWVKCHAETAAIALEALHFYADERFKGFGDDPEPYEHHLAQQAISELQELFQTHHRSSEQ